MRGWPSLPSSAESEMPDSNGILIRFSECYAVENNRMISLVHLVPSALKYAARTDWDDYCDILRFNSLRVFLSKF
tara:strand:- start:931 stop:1155 length:225 start_codon:yes stop_codon:yes gene_type:complete